MSIRTPQERRAFRRQRTRRKVSGTSERPRLAVFRSSKHIYAQVIDDAQGRTLASASSLKLSIKPGSPVEAAKAVGRLLAEKAKSSQVQQVVFDRGGRPYHGRVRALAEGAREAGLQF